MAEKREDLARDRRRVHGDVLASGGVIQGNRDATERELTALTGELVALDRDIAEARQVSRAAAAGLGLHRAHEPPPPSLHGERVLLPEGREILIRPIEPGDALQLEHGLEHLSAISRYRRFRAPVDHFSAAELTWLTQVDHHRHEALVALDPLSQTGIGVARYVCHPDDPACAHVTYVIADAWQSRGVGTALLERLATRARAGGVERLTALMLVGDAPARRLLDHIADELGEQRDGGIVEITARLRPPTP